MSTSVPTIPDGSNHHDLQASLSATADLARRLRRVLNEELECLRRSDLAEFERLQQTKESLLRAISEQPILPNDTRSPDVDPSSHPGWDEVFAVMGECRDLHRRNELLINARLDTIRGALNTLQNPDPVSSVETYDRKGRPQLPRYDLGWDEA